MSDRSRFRRGIAAAEELTTMDPSALVPLLSDAEVAAGKLVLTFLRRFLAEVESLGEVAK